MIWPANVLAIARAIAKAEGSNPEWNNPGDLTGLDGRGYAITGTANRDGVLIFADLASGEDALCRKIARMLAGQSEVYPPEMTLQDVGLKYSNGDPDWSTNVCGELRVPSSITLADLAKLEVLPCPILSTSASPSSPLP
jgi:hypothetical protein